MPEETSTNMAKILIAEYETVIADDLEARLIGLGYTVLRQSCHLQGCHGTGSATPA